MALENLTVSTDENGNIVTNDSQMNETIRSVEEELGMKLAVAVPAIGIIDDPDSKLYLLLLEVLDSEDGEEIRDWAVKMGRQDTYDYLKNLVISEAIDPHKSFIIAGDVKFDEAITVYKFLKSMREKELVLDGSDFEIDEYGLGENVPEPKITD